MIATEHYDRPSDYDNSLGEPAISKLYFSKMGITKSTFFPKYSQNILPFFASLVVKMPLCPQRVVLQLKRTHKYKSLPSGRNTK